jgi:hypothetical protein
LLRLLLLLLLLLLLRLSKGRAEGVLRLLLLRLRLRLRTTEKTSRLLLASTCTESTKPSRRPCRWLGWCSAEK